MNEQDIIQDFFLHKSNTDKILGLLVSKEVYDFIISTSNGIYNGEESFYKVGNSWHRIKIKEEL